MRLIESIRAGIFTPRGVGRGEAIGVSKSVEGSRARLERVGSILTALAVLYMAAFAGGVILVIESGRFGGEAVQFDFVAFWAAAKLALAGNPVGAFEASTLREAQGLLSTARVGNMFWFYPPALQLLFIPFALMPYWVSWLLFNLGAMTLFAYALWRKAPALPLGHNLLIAAPIVIIVFRLGQLSLLWCGVLVLALAALSRERVVAAGLLISLLSIKPQLGILIPVALIAGQHWRVLLWACLGGVVVHGVPTIVVGLDYWGAFIDQIRFATATMATDSTRWDLMVSPYSFLRFLGGEHQAAMMVQYGVSIALAAGIARIWASRSTGFDFMAGALFLAVPIATPYAYYYELAACIPAAIFLVRAGYGARLIDPILLVLLVLGPAVFWISTELAPLFAPVLALAFVRAIFVARQSWIPLPREAGIG